MKQKKKVENGNFRKVLLEVKKEKKKCFLVLVFSHITSVTVLGRKKCKGGRKKQQERRELSLEKGRQIDNLNSALLAHYLTIYIKFYLF